MTDICKFPSSVPERIEGAQRAWGRDRGWRQREEAPLRGDTLPLLPRLQLCLSPNLPSTVSQGSACPVLSLPTATLGQLFPTRFTFLLIFFLPSRAVPSSASPLAVKWAYPGKQQVWGWPRSDGSRLDSATIDSFIQRPNQPTNPTWLLCTPALALLGTQPGSDTANSQGKQIKWQMVTKAWLVV